MTPAVNKYVANGIKSSNKIVDTARKQLTQNYSSENLEFYMRAWAHQKAYENIKIKLEAQQGLEAFKKLNSLTKRTMKYKNDSIITVSDDYFQLLFNEIAKDVYSNFLDFLQRSQS